MLKKCKIVYFYCIPLNWFLCLRYNGFQVVMKDMLESKSETDICDTIVYLNITHLFRLKKK